MTDDVTNRGLAGLVALACCTRWFQRYRPELAGLWERKLDDELARLVTPEEVGGWVDRCLGTAGRAPGGEGG